MTTIALDAPAGASPGRRGQGLVRAWLVLVALMVFAMVIVGGATRLTDSGLSITEWQPLLGAIPPMTDAAWAEAFAKYKAIPQYTQMNQGMDLAAFKFIFWWEWAHRFLGRMIGVVFFVPFVAFLATGLIARRDAGRFAAIFVLGGIQGAVGWWMVASGLVDRVSVAPYRLAVHLTLASIIFAALVWTAASLGRNDRRENEAPRIRTGAALVVAMVFVQIFLGALVAGNDAGLVYNTWPSMNGFVVPPEWLAMEPMWRNFFENHATVQFVHRGGAYILTALALIQAIVALRLGQSAPVRRSAVFLILAVLAQVVIGIGTLVMVVPLGMALLHQAFGILVLTAATLHLRAATAAT
ncbi:COX15/CtaA family protein [Methyloraptor flagellatus]|uniref:Heme A synthase n=1 Tax=Methyloraptor flagellatus TaxID=3162530 RepID=A0AAU7XFI5_9HYPH